VAGVTGPVQVDLASKLALVPGTPSFDDCKAAIEDIGYEAFPVAESTDDANKMTFLVEGMTCDHCVKTITNVLKAIEGVSDATVDLAAGRATIVGHVPFSVRRLFPIISPDFHIEILKSFHLVDEIPSPCFYRKSKRKLKESVTRQRSSLTLLPPLLLSRRRAPSRNCRPSTHHLL